MAVPEASVIDGFHVLLQASLAVATTSGLLDRETLAHFSPDAQIDGPALSLLFAALRARVDSSGHLSIDVPSTELSTESIHLSAQNCPATLRPLWEAWTGLVPRVERLGPSYTKLLARLVLNTPVSDDSLGLDRDEAVALALAFRALALEIGQRRSFVMRYQADLQSALDYAHETQGDPELRSDFREPPLYSSAPSTSDDNPVMVAIREVLHAALAEVLASSPALISRLHTSDAEKPRAFFAALALAVLLVATERCDLAPPGRIHLISFGRSSAFAALPATIDAESCPEHLRPLLLGLLGIAGIARQAADADDRAAMQRALTDEPDVPTSVDRLRAHFINEASPLLSVGQLTLPGSRLASLPPDLQRIANAINELAMSISALPDFVGRRSTVFEILSGVAGSE